MTFVGGRWSWAAVLTVAFSLVARRAHAETRSHLLVIGNNQPFMADGAQVQGPAASVLRFADDDAAAFFDFMSAFAQSAHLLTVMDAETQATYEALAPIARPPSLRELREAVASLAQEIAEEHRRGDHSVLYLFFSGHGFVTPDGLAALALIDGAVTQSVLYDEVLDKLPADYVHVFVDACHAEAVVRPRDVDAQVVDVSSTGARAFLTGSTLARFPQVGAIVAATSQAQAHEWDLLRHGVFTHEILSALRGGADVNHDGRIEYSEVYAFLRSANRGVDDARARVNVVARPPALDRRVAIVDLARFPRERTARLKGIRGSAGLVRLEDGAGRQLAEVHGDVGYVADLLVPSGTAIYVGTGSKEARFVTVPGGTTDFDRLTFSEPRQRPRGALDDSLRRGLFAAEFGRGYYLGLTDEVPDLASVSFEPASAPSVRAVAEERDDRATGPRTRILVAAGASTAVARAIDGTFGGRVGLRPLDGSGLIVSVDALRGSAANVSEWWLDASAGWAWSRRVGSLQSWLGATAGGGAIEQSATGASARWSGVISAGPALGLGMPFGKLVSLWAEAQASGIAYRRDADTIASVAFSAWLGGSFAR
jgi:hypothetical protein